MPRTGRPPRPLGERFWEKVDVRGFDECWEWTSYIVKATGYGRFAVAGKQVGAHVMAYELVAGDVPDGLVLDHLCRNRSCVNPNHLEPVSLGENVLRGEAPPAKNARKTHCKRDHVFDEQNTYVHKGQRNCRACHNARQRERNRLCRSV